MAQNTRTIVAWGRGKAFKLEVPEDAKITYGPWSPPRMDSGRGYAPPPGSRAGTLRVYKTEKNVLGVFSGVEGFYDTSLGYANIDPSLIELFGAEEQEQDKNKARYGLDMVEVFE